MFYRFRAELSLLLVTLIAASGWIFSKEALVELTPWLFMGIRFLLAGAVLLLCGYGHWDQLLKPRQLGRSLGLGVVMAMAMLLWILGLHYGTHLGEGAFITSLGVVMVPVVGRLFFNERPSLSTWSALPLAIAGLALLSLDGGFQFELGQLFYFSAALLLAVHFSMVSRAAVAMSAIILTGVQLVVVGLISLSLSAWVEPWPTTVSSMIWVWLLASALLATSLRFFLQTYGQGLTPASHAALIMVLEPVWTALFAVLWFGEQISAMQGLGCGLIFASLLVSRLRWLQRLWRGKDVSPTTKTPVSSVKAEQGSSR